MSNEYEAEKQAERTEHLATEIAEAEVNEVTQSDENKPEETLYFWSEPGVCG